MESYKPFVSAPGFVQEYPYGDGHLGVVRPVGAGGASEFGVCPYNILVVVGLDSGASGAGEGKEDQMAIRRVRPSKVLVGTQFSRRDFLKLSGTGLAGAGPVGGTAGWGNVFWGGGGGGGAGSSTLNLNLTAEI